MIEFQPFVKDLHLKTVQKFFDKKDFYYDTHIPDKITYDDINELVGYYSSHVSIIKYLEKEIGLCDYIIENNTAKIEFRISSNAAVDDEIQFKILNTYIECLFNSLPINKISKYVYAFDNMGMKLFENYFISEGIYGKYIFKDNTYWDVAVFSMLREEFEGLTKKVKIS